MKKTGLQKEATYSAEEIKQLRCDAGNWLKSLRLARGYTQNELQNLVAPHIRTKHISAVEIGHYVVSPENYELWARSLDVDPREFTRTLLKFYNPIVYKAIFG